uniref:Glycosyltransferase family 32 protein n=1 Tax=Chaetoceros debilis TaxID=122233 RepID=A0A7S3VDH2_9STRA
MHTFYEAVPNGCCGMTKEGHKDLLAAWKKSWEDRGWETVVLTEEDARQHPDFESINQKLQDLDVNAYNRRCYWRWLAIVTDGGGWMSDYDVFPLSLNGEMGLALEQSGTFTSYAHHVPCLIHASAKEWDRILHIMIELLPNSPEEVYERVTDMYSLLNIDIEQGRSGMQWTSEVAPHFTYHRNEEGWQWMDCNFGWKHIAIHLSHHSCAEAFKTDHYPEIDDVDSDTHGLPDNWQQAVQRRSEAALKVMDDYKEYCMPTSSW